MRPARLCALLCALLLCLPGCMPPQGARAELARAAAAHLKEGEKALSLDTLAQAWAAEGPGPAQDELRARWWDTLTAIGDIPAQPLTEEDCKGLSALAYLMGFADCCLSTRELSKDSLLSPLEIYYGMSLWLPLYARPGWDAPPFYGAYPPQATDIAQAFCTLSAHDADAFIRQATGTGIPNPDAEGEYRRGGIDCQGGQYRIYEQDIVMPDALVCAYRYLGDDLFYVAFDGDDYATPGPDGEHRGILPDFMRLIVRRSDSVWGFTAVAKLSGMYGAPLPDGLRAPEDVTHVENASLIAADAPALQ